jgi:hypothetical protein
VLCLSLTSSDSPSVSIAHALPERFPRHLSLPRVAAVLYLSRSRVYLAGLAILSARWHFYPPVAGSVAAARTYAGAARSVEVEQQEDLCRNC